MNKPCSSKVRQHRIRFKTHIRFLLEDQIRLIFSSHLDGLYGFSSGWINGSSPCGRQPRGWRPCDGTAPCPNVGAGPTGLRNGLEAEGLPRFMAVDGWCSTRLHDAWKTGENRDEWCLNMFNNDNRDGWSTSGKQDEIHIWLANHHKQRRLPCWEDGREDRQDRSMFSIPHLPNMVENCYHIAIIHHH